MQNPVITKAPLQGLITINLHFKAGSNSLILKFAAGSNGPVKTKTSEARAPAL